MMMTKIMMRRIRLITLISLADYRNSVFACACACVFVCVCVCFFFFFLGSVCLFSFGWVVCFRVSLEDFRYLSGGQEMTALTSLAIEVRSVRCVRAFG